MLHIPQRQIAFIRKSIVSDASQQRHRVPDTYHFRGVTGSIEDTTHITCGEIYRHIIIILFTIIRHISIIMIGFIFVNQIYFRKLDLISRIQYQIHLFMNLSQYFACNTLIMQLYQYYAFTSENSKKNVIIYIKYHFYYVKMSLMFHACTIQRKTSEDATYTPE